MTISPFSALRPEPQHAKAVASRPYDVLNSSEAKTEAQGNPESFLHITKSEIDLPAHVDVHSPEVYEKAKENLSAFVSRGILFRESKPCYYIYRLTMNGRSQAGLVCGSAVADYDSGLIKKHELTRPEKEQDRITHMQVTGAQTGNVFLAYRSVKEIDTLLENCMQERSPQYCFVSDDGIEHEVWVISDDATIADITKLFAEKVSATYIADGHHRAASAAKVRAVAKGNLPGADMFLTTIFPDSSLAILDYNRVIADLNGLSAAEFLKNVGERFAVEHQNKAFRPQAAHEFGLYIDKNWYKLTANKSIVKDDALGVLDINILQENILAPLLNIHDQRTDKRIDFIGGIRGLKALEQKVDDGEAALAVSLYPVTMQQLFAVADSGEVMPPKSTWFEPKLRDGLLTHLIN